MGSSTTRIGRLTRSRCSPASWRARHSSQSRSPLEGLHEKRQPATASMSGSSPARARTAVDLAVPRSPRISTPPIAGLTALRTRAVFIWSWPTRAVNGRTSGFAIRPIVARTEGGGPQQLRSW